MLILHLWRQNLWLWVGLGKVAACSWSLSWWKVIDLSVMEEPLCSGIYSYCMDTVTVVKFASIQVSVCYIWNTYSIVLCCEYRQCEFTPIHVVGCIYGSLFCFFFPSPLLQQNCWKFHIHYNIISHCVSTQIHLFILVWNIATPWIVIICAIFYNDGVCNGCV